MKKTRELSEMSALLEAKKQDSKKMSVDGLASSTEMMARLIKMLNPKTQNSINDVCSLLNDLSIVLGISTLDLTHFSPDFDVIDQGQKKCAVQVTDRSK